MLCASGTCGTPGSGGVFWSNLSTASRGTPWRAATSSTGGAQTYGAKPSRDGLRLHPRDAHASTAAAWQRESFGAGERNDDSRRRARALGGRRDHLERLEERLDPEPAGRPGEPARRQHVRRAGGVVADDRRAADEHRAGVADRGSSAAGSATCSSRCSGAYASDRPTASSSDATSSTRTFVVTRNERGHRVGEPVVVGEQQRVAVGAVLGLREEVGGDAVRIGRRVGDHDDLARPGGQIDPHAARDEQLRRRDVARSPGRRSRRRRGIVSVP